MSGLRDLGESIGDAVLDGIGRASARVQERKPLPADLLESETAYLAVFDAPGATATDVSVRFEQDTLNVRIDRFREFYDDYEMRLPGRGMALSGSVTFPPEASVDPAAAEATVTTNGTLQVRVPKVDPGDGDDEPIQIETGEGDEADESDESTHDGDGHESEPTDGETAGDEESTDGET